MITVSRESFQSATEETKLLLIYDMLVEQHTHLISKETSQETMCKEKSEACERRFKKMESKGIVNGSLSAVGGIIGGFTAMVIKLTFWNNP